MKESENASYDSEPEVWDYIRDNGFRREVSIPSRV